MVHVSHLRCHFPGVLGMQVAGSTVPMLHCVHLRLSSFALISLGQSGKPARRASLASSCRQERTLKFPSSHARGGWCTVQGSPL